MPAWVHASMLPCACGPRRPTAIQACSRPPARACSHAAMHPCAADPVCTHGLMLVQAQLSGLNSQPLSTLGTGSTTDFASLPSGALSAQPVDGVDEEDLLLAQAAAAR
eukprot:243511-Chlamydomonas_euryale.AAC.1